MFPVSKACKAANSSPQTLTHAQVYKLLAGLTMALLLQMATVLFYLTNVEEGGETVFPLEGRDGLERLNGLNYKACDQGLRVSRSCTMHM